MNYCDIVIPVWNQLGITKACLDSVISSTDYPYRLIIIDNNSEEDTSQFLRSFSEQYPDKVLLIRNNENLGYIRATNQGIKVSNGKYICLLNNDTVVYPGWLSAMVEIIELENDIGLVNPASNHFGISPDNNDVHSGSPYMGMGRCIGFCVLIKRELVDRIGYLDERFGMGYGDDIAYSAAASDAGYRCVMAKKAYVFHHGKTSFGKDKKAKKYAERQRTLISDLLEKRPRIVVFLTGDVNSDRSKSILTLLRRLADRGIRCKVILKDELRKKPYEHMYVDFRTKAGLTAYGILRFLIDRKSDYFFTDSRILFNILKMVRNVGARKRVLLLEEKIYTFDGTEFDYPGDVIKFHKFLNES